MVTIFVTHSYETGLSTQFIKVPSKLASKIAGIYGDIEDEKEVSEELLEDIKKIIEVLHIKYDTSVDNLKIGFVPDDNEIEELK